MEGAEGRYYYVYNYVLYINNLHICVCVSVYNYACVWCVYVHIYTVYSMCK